MANVSLLAPRADTLREGPQGGSNVVLLTHTSCLRSAGFSVEIFAAESERDDVEALPLDIQAPLLGSLSYCGRFVRRSTGSVLIGYQEPTVALLAPRQSIIRFGYYTPLPRYHGLPLARERFGAGHYVFPSAYLRDRWHGDHPIVPRDHTHVIPNAVDLDAFFPDGEGGESGPSEAAADNGVLRVGFAGQWSVGKGMDDLLTAWTAVEERESNVELRLAGGPDLWTGTDGTENRSLAERVRDVAEVLNVRTLGKLPREEMPDFWRSLDMAVVPSKRAEMFGLVALEAMACGVPVVATEDGALPWLVDDGGITVPTGDPEALADSIVRLLQNCELRSELGRRARRRAQKFSLARARSRLTDLVRKVEAADEERAAGSSAAV